MYFFPQLINKQTPSLPSAWGFWAFCSWFLALHLTSGLFPSSQVGNSLVSNLNSHWHQRDRVYTVPWNLKSEHLAFSPSLQVRGLAHSLWFIVGTPLSLPGMLPCPFYPQTIPKQSKLFTPPSQRVLRALSILAFVILPKRPTFNKLTPKGRKQKSISNIGALLIPRTHET